MISTSAVLLRRLTLFDDTLKNLRSGLDKGPIIINAIARQVMGGDYAAARRESYKELRKMHTDISRIAANKKREMENSDKHYTKTKINSETSKIYIIEHSEKLRQKYTQVIKTMAARYQINFDYEDQQDEDELTSAEIAAINAYGEAM